MKPVICDELKISRDLNSTFHHAIRFLEQSNAIQTNQMSVIVDENKLFSIDYHRNSLFNVFFPIMTTSWLMKYNQLTDDNIRFLTSFFIPNWSPAVSSTMIAKASQSIPILKSYGSNRIHSLSMILEQYLVFIRPVFAMLLNQSENNTLNLSSNIRDVILKTNHWQTCLFVHRNAINAIRMGINNSKLVIDNGQNKRVDFQRCKTLKDVITGTDTI